MLWFLFLLILLYKVYLQIYNVIKPKIDVLTLTNDNYN